MDKSLVSVTTNEEIYITHAEFQGCFIKIWASFYSQKRTNLEKCVQDYTSYSKEFNKLDLYGNTLYVYIWKTDFEVRVYRCQVLFTDLIAKTHTIMLIDYGQKMVVPYFDVREVVMGMANQATLNTLFQRATLHTFLLNGFLSKRKSNNELTCILCDKYYKYRKDFDVGGVTFITIYNIDQKLIDSGLADTIDLTKMISIANSMSSVIMLNNKRDVANCCSIPSKSSTLYSYLKPQQMDYTTLVDVIISRVIMENNSILLTVRIIDMDSKTLRSMLDSIDRKNLKLAPVLEVHTPCLIIFHNEIVRAIILEVKIDRLYVDLVDYGLKESVPRSAIFEIPPDFYTIEMRSLHVVLDNSNYNIFDESMFLQKYFQMLPLKIDPNFGLYKVKLFIKHNDNLIDVCDSLNSICVGNNEQCSIPAKRLSFTITEINEEMKCIDSFMASNSDCFINNQNTTNVDLKETENTGKVIQNVNLNKTQIINLKKTENEELKKTKETEKELENHISRIMFLRKENLNDQQEIIASLIDYKSPFNFRVRQHNPGFETFLYEIKSVLQSRYILKKCDLVKNMFVIYQNCDDSIYRAKIIEMDSENEKIQLLLVDEGDEIINEMFEKIKLYSFIASDTNLPGQLVLNCSLNNMWFPEINADTSLILQPFFSYEILYKILIIKTDEFGVHFVQMIQYDTNIDVSDIILESGIGQRLCAVMKTDKNPYEESLLKGQSFLSYVYHYHLKLFIQPEPNTVVELEEEILEHINNDSNFELFDANSLQQNTYCLATVNNKQWYRAVIKNINEESIIVNMFDIGLLTDVSFKQIRPITNNLMEKPQLCINCNLETNSLNINITEKTLYNVTVSSIDANGKPNVSIKEHYTVPLSNPIVRGIEKISSLHVDGDLTYLQRFQDKLKVDKMFKTLSKLNGKLKSKSSIVPGDICFFENHGQYFRCLVYTISSKTAVVHCIDFGYEKTVEKKKLQYLGGSKIALLPALVITVKTFPLAYSMSNTMFLANMYVEDDGTLIAVPNKMASIQTQNELMETLINGCLVKVTCVYSSDDVWIVPHLYFDRLKIISNILVKMQSKIIPAVTEVGSLCAALHSKTKEWHRALILDKDGETENMLAIDSGERFKALKTTRLASEIQKIPNCALHCRAVSNVDVEKLFSKDVKCKLISYDHSLLEMELSLDEIDKTVISSTRQVTEWTVNVTKFVSFNDFYVKVVDDKTDAEYINKQLTLMSDKLKDFTKPPSAGTLVAALTDREDGIWYKAEVLTENDHTIIIVRLLSDGSICKSIKIKVLPDNIFDDKLCFHCYLEDYIDDVNINDPKNVNIVSDVIMTSKWTMRTFSKVAPYKVTLLCDGQNCINILHNILSIESGKVCKNSELPEKEIEKVVIIKHDSQPLPECTSSLVEDSKVPVWINGFKKDLILPDVETVIIKNLNSFKHFYAFSKSLSMLYTEQINNDLDVCIVKLPLNQNLIGTIVVTSIQESNDWCRAKVKSIHSDGVSANCYLLDSGYYQQCTEFYKPTDFLRLCPPLVRCCSLYVPKLDGKENEVWYPNINDMFLDILTIQAIEFDMVIKEDGDPCSVILRLQDNDIAEMLYPVYAQLTYIKSLTDFKVRVLSNEQKTLTELLESNSDIPLIQEITPIIGNLYLAKMESKLKRVKFNAAVNKKYKVVDIDDTLDISFVDSLYEIPEIIRDINMFTLHCSLIIDDKQEKYSLSKFKKLANAKVIFIMCIINESDGQAPNLIKLYADNKDVLDWIKS